MRSNRREPISGQVPTQAVPQLELTSLEPRSEEARSVKWIFETGSADGTHGDLRPDTDRTTAKPIVEHVP